MQTEIIRLSKQDYKNYFESGLEYASYFEAAERQSLEGNKEGNAAYLPINVQRMKRLSKTFQPTDAILAALKALKHPTIWLVITEDWCGDSSQSIPVLHAISQLSEGKIRLRMVYRDAHPALMDAHLTNGGRAIPKLIQLDSHFNITGIWGPRPNVVQKLVKEWKSNPETSAHFSELLHKWYANDKQQAMQDELLKLLQKANQFCPDCFA